MMFTMNDSPSAGVQPQDPTPETPLQREDAQFRFHSHVHEYLCPAAPDKKQLGARSVFAGGGITNCPDWQVEFARLVNEKFAALVGGDVSSTDYVSILNPRRPHFPIGDPNASPIQIAWEHKYLRASKAISLWFPNATEGPISLFETGKWMMHAKPMFLGIEPGYPRTEELIAHVKAVRPGVEVSDTLDAHAERVAQWAAGKGRVDVPVFTPQIRPNTAYLVGGIVGCPDWQLKMTELLTGTALQLVNPRTENFTRETSEDFSRAVKQNRERLDECEAAIAWFPKEQMTPVALLELGSLVASGKPVFIGVDPGYKRQIDVEIQTELERPEIDIAYSLEELSEQVKRYYSMRR